MWKAFLTGDKLKVEYKKRNVLSLMLISVFRTLSVCLGKKSTQHFTCSKLKKNVAAASGDKVRYLPTLPQCLQIIFP